jgi:hypothetical protein
MYEMAKKAREAMKSKAKTLTSAGKGQNVSSADWTPAEPLDADVKTGLRPISRRAFKKGGKVMGEPAKADMGKKPRTSGGMAKEFADAKVNRNVKDANEEREGETHIGGLKRGGPAKKALGGPMAGANAMMQKAQQTGGVDPQSMRFSDVKKGLLSPLKQMPFKKGGSAEKHEDVAEDKALIKKMVKPSARTARKEGGGVFSGPGYPGKVPGAVAGGRTAHAAGGKAKGKTNINILIGAGKPAGAADMAANPMGGPTPPPVPMPVPPPQGGGMPPAMPVPMPPPPPPGGGGAPMPRRAGGRTYRSYKDMDAGSGSGLGRLEKTEIASKKR